MFTWKTLFTLLATLTLGSALALFTAGCRTDEDDDDASDDDASDDDAGDDDDDDYRHELTVTNPVIGDFSCLGDNQTAPAPGETGNLVGFVLDFSEDEPVAGAKLYVWANDDPSGGEGAADFEFSDGTDQTGQITIGSGVVNACEKFAYKVWTEWVPQETMPTFETGNVIAPPGDTTWEDSFEDFEILSVSYATYQIIPLSLAIDPDPAKGLAAGAFYDCVGERVENAQVLVKDNSGNLVEDVYIRYFVDETPDRDQQWTSDDGIFGAIDVPPGAWTIEVWGVRDGGMPDCPEPEVDGRCKLASVEVFVIPDSVNIANARMVEYPAGCYE
jgi:hypothetical protein